MPLKGLPGVLGEHNLEENNRLNADRVPKHESSNEASSTFPPFAHASSNGWARKEVEAVALHLEHKLEIRRKIPPKD